MNRETVQRHYENSLRSALDPITVVWSAEERSSPTRLAKAFRAEFERRAQAVGLVACQVSADFGDRHLAELESWLLEFAQSSLAAYCSALEGEFTRTLHKSGHSLMASSSGLDHVHSLQAAATANRIREYFWTKRNVPMPARHRPETSLTFNGPVGAVQTGDHAVANVQQQWIEADVKRLVSALSALGDQIQASSDLAPEDKSQLIADVAAAKTEVLEAKPRTQQLLRTLGGMGAVVRTVASLKPFLDAVKEAAAAVGIHL